MPMATTLIQAERWLTLDTPLGPDALVATEVRGIEGVSRLFEFTVHALSAQEVVDPQALLGQSVTLSMARPGGKRRLTNGIVTSFAGGPLSRSGYRLYSLTISPSLWLLDRSSDYKTFQQKTVVKIVEEILGEWRISFEKKLRKTYEEREYCVQFGETDLAFVERILADAGIFYYFTHSDGKHTLVLTDSPSGYADCLQKDVAYRQDQQEVSDSIYALHTGVSLTDAEWTFEEYDFEKAGQKAEAKQKTALKPASAKTWQHYRYRAAAKGDEKLSHLAGAAVDGADAGFERVSGSGTCASFVPGHRFSLTEHPVGALVGKQFVVTEVTHEAVDRAHFTAWPGTEGKPYYRNSFSCVPSARTASPASLPRKPRAYGPQTAVVVGPKGEEIHTDKYGRIRVQFHWDRYGKNDDASSCFVRVAQSLAGKNWGTVFVPRIGMEVVVQFIDGDPDRPLVTGAVYNNENMPPWALPANATKGGILTRSSKGGQASNANELSFEDKKDAEKIFFHAEKDFVREVENDDTLDVGHDQKRTIKNDRTTTITEGNDTYTLDKGNRSETLKAGNETLDIDKGNRTVTLGQGNDSLALKGGDRAVDITSGNDTLKLGGGNRTTTLASGDDTLTLNAGNQTTKAAAGKITLEALQGITLKCGSNTIEVAPQGITINGLTITIKADANADVKAPIVNVAADGMAIVKGGIVKIN